jgi:NAD(P)-dependent dehydrogenase (short-subunit alcohol dehydrogenase family)
MTAAFDFTGAEVLVVGASRAGIGAAIARAFQEAGANVAITGVEPEPAPEDRGRFAYTQIDVTDNAAITALSAAMPRLDVLVNGAAITARGEEMAPDFFAKVVDINLTGSFRMALAFQPQLAASKGSLINIASMYATFGSPRNPAYGASKAAIGQLTKSLAIAWAPEGVRVNAIAPGFIVTEQSARSRTDPVHVQRVTDRTPLARWGQPQDLAGVALFLASPMAAFITGATIPVDGGYSIG